MDPADIAARFKSYAVTEAEAEGMTATRHKAEALAHHIDATVPDGREKSTAITKLEEAVFWANAGLARAAGQSGRD